MAANPSVFVVGCPRSGTTLLRRMLDAHPQLAMTRETHWLTRVYAHRIGLRSDGTVAPDLLDRLLEDRRFRRMEVDVQRLRRLVTGAEPVSYARFVTCVFDLYAERHGKPLAGDKTPGYVRKVALLAELWPWARFVHIVRDGRDVCLSLADWRPEQFARRLPTWRDDQVSTAALWWAWTARLGRDAALGAERYREVHYEALVADPSGECRALCRFLGLREEPDAMTRFHERRPAAATAPGADNPWRAATPGLRDWRSQMPAGDVERFEAAAGDALEEFGYLRRHAAATGPVSEHAARMRARFDDHLRTKRAVASPIGPPR